MWGLGKGGDPGRGEGVGKALPHPEASNRIQGKCARPGIKPRRTLAPVREGLPQANHRQFISLPFIFHRFFFNYL